ncbi:MAG TPA: hypothetical protein VK129_09170, partial [Terriglobales bacterium]|nr:hypothetical protein [Terriglobales bacterium]
GGPIKKDKTFYFGTYEGMRQANGTNINPQVPTDATRNGDVPLSIVQNKDPKKDETFLCAFTTATTCHINVDPKVQPFLNLYQHPTPGLGKKSDAGDGTGTFFAAPLQVTSEDYFMTRVDHQITENMRIFARYSFDKDRNVLPNFSGSAISDEQDAARRQYSTIQVSNTLRPTLVNSFRIAFNRTYQNFDDVVNTDLSKLKL